MIAIATLAALGQALHEGLIFGIGLVLLLALAGCATAVAVLVVGARSERRMERMDAALPPQGPGDGEPLTDDEWRVLGAMEARGEPGSKESGSL